MTANAHRGAHSWTARLRTEAYRRGFLEGRAMALIEVLELRGVTLRTADRHFILGCSDIDAMDHWARRAWQVSTISELFDD